jgi:hypothetical protein
MQGLYRGAGVCTHDYFTISQVINLMSQSCSSLPNILQLLNFIDPPGVDQGVPVMLSSSLLSRAVNSFAAATMQVCFSNVVASHCVLMSFLRISSVAFKIFNKMRRDGLMLLESA